MKFEINEVADILRVACGAEKENIYGFELVGYTKPEDHWETYVIRFDGNTETFVVGVFINEAINFLRTFAESDMALKTMYEWTPTGPVRGM